MLGGSAVMPDSIKSWFIDHGYSADNIKRLWGDTREGTAESIIAEFGAKQGTPVIISNEDNYPDALSISTVSASRGYPIILTKGDKLSDYAKSILTTIKPSKIYVTGGTGVISKSVTDTATSVSDLSSSDIVRLGGADRYATSLAIANAFKESTDTAVIVGGQDYPDAIAGSVLASKTNSPILLTPTSNLTNIKGFIGDTSITKAYILGGNGVITDSTMNSLKK
jgi:putative cell wall-binding protein